MSKQSKTATDALKLQTNAEESTETIYSETQINERYCGTEIYIRGNEEEGYFATLGDYLLLQKQPTIDQIKARLREPDVSLIIDIAAITTYGLHNYLERTYRLLEPDNTTINDYYKKSIPTEEDKNIGTTIG